MIEKINTTTEEISIDNEPSIAEKYKKLELENLKLNAEIERLMKDKEDEDNLTFEMIHDVKNQFNSLLGFSELLNEGDLTEEEIERYSKFLMTTSKDAYRITEDFLNWKKSGSSKLEVKMSKMELNSYIKSFIDLSIEEANKKEIIFENKIDNDISVMADSSMLKSVLENLILNAIKFTEPNGNVSISSEQEGDLVKIYVKDNGRGVPKERLNNFFNSLGVSTVGTKGEKGTGIGIYSCKKMIEKMNGTISVESEGEGKGTTIIVSLPTEKK